MMKTIVLHLILAGVMLLVTLIAGLIPIKIIKLLTSTTGTHRHRRKFAPLMLSLLVCFSGGVFLATCFLDIMPHVNFNYALLKERSGFDTTFPFPEFFACCGFFLVYAMEELVMKCFGKDAEMHHHHHHDDAHLSLKSTDDDDNSIKVGVNHQQQFSSKKNIKNHYQTADDTVSKSHHITIDNDDDELDVVLQSATKHISDPDVPDQQQQHRVLRSISFAIAMSFHSLLEGVALGVQTESAGIITLFLSLIIHKAIESFSVGLQIARSHTHQRLHMVFYIIIIYAMMTPIGSILGAFIQSSQIHLIVKDSATVFLEGLAVGTFIYVTFFEMIIHERINEHSNLIQLVAIIIGFLVISSLQLIEHGFDMIEPSMTASASVIKFNATAILNCIN